MCQISRWLNERQQMNHASHMVATKILSIAVSFINCTSVRLSLVVNRISVLEFLYSLALKVHSVAALTVLIVRFSVFCMQMNGGQSESVTRMVSQTMRWLSRRKHYQLDVIVEEWSGVLCNYTQIPARSDVRWRKNMRFNYYPTFAHEVLIVRFCSLGWIDGLISWPHGPGSLRLNLRNTCHWKYEALKCQSSLLTREAYGVV